MRTILISRLPLDSCGNGGIGHALATHLKEKGKFSNLTHMVCGIEFGGSFFKIFRDHSDLTNWVSGYTVISTLLPHESDDHLLAKGIKVTRTDVTSEESVLELKSFTESLTNGKLDILINNA